jgi:hypothetical protein
VAPSDSREGEKREGEHLGRLEPEEDIASHAFGQQHGKRCGNHTTEHYLQGAWLQGT